MYALASDFDNTLHFHDGMREEDLKAIKEFQKQGHLFGICTGRDIDGILNPSKKFDISYDFYICNTGSLILDHNLNPIIHKRIPFKYVKEISELIGDDIHLSLIYDHNMYHLNQPQSFRYPFGNDINSLDDIDLEEVDAFSLHLPYKHVKEATELINLIHLKYGHKFSAYQNNEHIDCTALGCSKGEAIEIIKNYYQVDHMCAIGDSFNDLPMFEHVENSFTFDYSSDEVKDKARYVVKSISECIDFLLKK